MQIFCLMITNIFKTIRNGALIDIVLHENYWIGTNATVNA